MQNFSRFTAERRQAHFGKTEVVALQNVGARSQSDFAAGPAAEYGDPLQGELKPVTVELTVAASAAVWAGVSQSAASE